MSESLRTIHAAKVFDASELGPVTRGYLLRHTDLIDRGSNTMKGVVVKDVDVALQASGLPTHTRFAIKLELTSKGVLKNL